VWALMSVSEPGEPAEMAHGLRSSANLFSALGTEPRLGRSFRADGETLGNHRVLVISHRYWQNRFGGDAHVIGRTLRVDGEAHEIVGVLPASLNDRRHFASFDLYRPLALTEQEPATVRPLGSAWSGVAPAPSAARKPKPS
jgi:hypothetical protein